MIILFSSTYIDDGGYDFEIFTSNDIVNKLRHRYNGSYIKCIDLPEETQCFYTVFDSSIDEYPVESKLQVFTHEEDARAAGGSIIVWVNYNNKWIGYEYEEYTVIQNELAVLQEDLKKSERKRVK